MSDVLPNIKWRLTVHASEEIPDGYGVAYDLWLHDSRVAMPIPLNLIVSGWRALRMWLRFPPWWRVNRRIERARFEAYREGYNDCLRYRRLMDS